MLNSACWSLAPSSATSSSSLELLPGTSCRLLPTCASTFSTLSSELACSLLAVLSSLTGSRVAAGTSSETKTWRRHHSPSSTEPSSCLTPSSLREEAKLFTKALHIILQHAKTISHLLVRLQQLNHRDKAVSDFYLFK